MRSLLGGVASIFMPSRRRLLPFILFLNFSGFWLLHLAFASVPYPGITKIRPNAASPTPDTHPITQLISNATAHFEDVLKQRSFNLHEAAQRYRQRRGRHPPPGFDLWFKQAVKDYAIVIESFFDRIHHDINLLWALKPHEMRIQAASLHQVIKIRNKRVIMVTNDPDRQPWIQHWTALVEKGSNLPDLDMALNIMDETQILTPWETINKYVEVEQQQ